MRRDRPDADRKFKRPLLRLRRFSVSHSGDVGSGLAPVGPQPLNFLSAIVADANRDLDGEEQERHGRIPTKERERKYPTAFFVESISDGLAARSIEVVHTKIYRDGARNE